MRAPFRAAIIGCGAIAGGFDEQSGFQHTFTHAGAYRRHERFELAAIADPVAERLAAFQQAWGVSTAHTDYHELLQTGPYDVLSVCTPDHLHFPVIQAALESKQVRAILSEKPIAGSAHEARQLVTACRARGVSLFVNYNRLWDPLHGEVKQWIASGGMGRLQGGVGYYVRGLKHNGTTMFSTLRLLLNQEVVSVQALGATEATIPNDLALDGVLTFEDGSQVHVMAADKFGYGHSVFEIDLMGNGGRARLFDNGFQVERYETAEYKRYPGVRELVPLQPNSGPIAESRMNETLLLTLDELAAHLNKGPVHLEYALGAARDMAIAEGLIDSYQSGGRPMPVFIESVR